MTVRRHRISGGDIRSLGGTVSVVPSRNWMTNEPFFVVSHISGGGDIAWRSLPIPDEDRALEAARVLAAFCGAVVQR